MGEGLREIFLAGIHRRMLPIILAPISTEFAEVQMNDIFPLYVLFCNIQQRLLAKTIRLLHLFGKGSLRRQQMT